MRAPAAGGGRREEEPGAKDVFHRMMADAVSQHKSPPGAARCFLVHIKGDSTWRITNTGKIDKFSWQGHPEETAPDAVFTCASQDVLQWCLMGSMSIESALIRGEISVSGDIVKAREFGRWCKDAHDKRRTSSSSSSSSYQPKPRDEWMPDDATGECSLCSCRFNVVRRRHHCRFCGSLVCRRCSKSSLEGCRACDVCHNAAKASGGLSGGPHSGTHNSLLHGCKSSGEAQCQEVSALRTRVIELEKDLELQEERRMNFRAELLLRLVLTAHALVTASLAALVLAAVHILASMARTYIGYLLDSPAAAACLPAQGIIDVVTDVVGAATGSATLRGMDVPSIESTCGGSGAELELNSMGTTNGSLGSGSGIASAGISGSSSSSSSPAATAPLCFMVESFTSAGSSSTIPFLVYCIIIILGASLMLLHHIKSRGVYPRRVLTFMVAGVVLGGLRGTQVYTAELSPEESSQVWGTVQALLGPFSYHAICKLKGIWVKLGQYLSTRADAIPEEFINALAALQDAVPPTPWDDIKRILGEELGEVETLFQQVEHNPLASASIAQVHCGTLHCGRAIAIKVQHPDVDRLMKEDTDNVIKLITLVGWLGWDQGLCSMLSEWSSMVLQELDFVNEAGNLVRVRKALEENDQPDIIIPELIPEFTTPKVLVMSFCEGFKVSHLEELDRHKVDRAALAMTIANCTSFQIHTSGVFNGDPHPGNILVQPVDASDPDKGVKAVMLDWGLTKQISDSTRLGYSRFVIGCATSDVVMLLQGLDMMGITFVAASPLEVLQVVRFALRDTKPAPEAVRETAEQIKINEKVIGKAKKRSKLSGHRGPLITLPGDLFFLLRVGDMMHGLASKLGVRHKLLEATLPFAKGALRDALPVQERASSVIYHKRCLSPTEAKVRALVKTLVASEDITGCQVTVFHNGFKIVDTSAGTHSDLEQRPVRPTSLFCGHALTNLWVTTALHKLVEMGKVNFGTRIEEFWPAFGCNGKEATTLYHILLHQDGLQFVLPEEPTFSNLGDWDAMLKLLEEATPSWHPGTKTSYHYLTYGWLVGACVEKISGSSLSDFLSQEVLKPLGLEDEVFIGHLKRAGVQDARLVPAEGSLLDHASLEDVASDDVDEGEGPDVQASDPACSLLHRLSAAVYGNDPEEGEALCEFIAKLEGCEYFLDPRSFNHPSLREGVLPSAGGHMTSNALATLMNDLLQSLVGFGAGTLLGEDRVEQVRRPRVTARSPAHHLFGMPPCVRLGLGYQVFGFRGEVTKGGSLSHSQGSSRAKKDASKLRTRLSGFGQVTGGGSLAIADSSSGVAMCILVNKVNTGKGAVTKILELLCAELGVGDPVLVLDDL